MQARCFWWYKLIYEEFKYYLMPYFIYLNYLNLDQIYLFIHISPQRPKLNPFERTFIIKNVLAYLHMNLHDLHNSFITRILKQFEYFTKMKTIFYKYTFYIFNQYYKNSAIIVSYFFMTVHPYDIAKIFISWIQIWLK